MSRPRTADGSLVWMRCAGADYRRHSSPLFDAAYPDNPNHGTGPFETWVPFIEAIHNPPICHGKPRETEGATRMRHLTERFRERGIEADCWISYGFEQSTWCTSHGWSGRASEVDGDHHCPHWRLAQWVIRRHESAAEQSA